MELDFNTMVIGSLAVIIVMLLVYISYRMRAEKLPLISLNVDELLGRVKESEKLLQVIKAEKCWNCGSTEKEVIGNLYEDNEVKFACKGCGTEVIWKRGKKQWQVTTGTKSFLTRLEEKVAEEKGSTK